MSGKPSSPLLERLQPRLRSLPDLIGRPEEELHPALMEWLAELLGAQAAVLVFERVDGSKAPVGGHGLAAPECDVESQPGSLLVELCEGDEAVRVLAEAELPGALVAWLADQGMEARLLRAGLPLGDPELRAWVLVAGLAAEVDIDAVGFLLDSAAALLAMQIRAGRVGDRCRDLQGELASAQAAAAAANRSKSDFLANISHEIRTPMTSILGYAEILRDRMAGAVGDESLDVIIRNGRQLLAIFNDILDLSELEAGSLALNLGPVDIGQVVGDAMSAAEQRAEDKGLAVQVAVQGDLPQAIVSDGVRLTQVLKNVLDNAVRFTERGGLQLVIRPCAAADGAPQLGLEVSDTGIGMDAARVEGLFRPFQQLDASMSRSLGGTGLGLIISRHLAGLLEGGIEVASKPGKGTRVQIRIAATAAPGAATLNKTELQGVLAARRRQARESAEAAGPTRRPMEGRHILLIEDGRDNRLLISRILRKFGATVTVAEDGSQGRDRALAAQNCGTPFDLILMDMQMPVMDGYESTRALRSEGYQGPVIALTAQALAKDRQRCLDAGCSEYLSKPIDKVRLLSVMLGELVR